MPADQAFQTLFSKEYNNLCHYALSYLKDSHWAEDVVQETFIKFWEQQKVPADVPEARFYLVTAVRNNCISALRKQKNNKTQYTEDSPEPEPEPFITARQAKEEARERAAKIAAALDQLPPKCKEVFLLIKLHGMSYKQAAETLGLSLSTIENQMGKAIKLMRTYTLVLIFFALHFLIKRSQQDRGFYMDPAFYTIGALSNE